MTTNRFTADKATIRAELEHRARSHQVVTYGELAVLVGRTARGLGRILTAIRAEEKARGRPDLGALVVTVGTGLPSYIGSEPADRMRAIATQEAVFETWAAEG